MQRNSIQISKKINMEQQFYSLKDFGLQPGKSISVVSDDFQKFVDQMKTFEHKSYWVMANSGIGSNMYIENEKEPVCSFISNDYLGMSQREETKKAGADAIYKYGTGACASQAIGGYLDIHYQLEKSIAEFTGQEDAILFSSGFGSNTELLRAILGPNDIAYIDSYIHTSALSGLRGTNVKHIGHNNLDYLDMILGRDTGKYDTRVVIIDGVYSQNGDLSLLPEYIEVCHKHGCLLAMDDAHGIGVMGENGRGTAEFYDCLGKVDIITGTCSKSFGCVGGFVASSRKLIQYLKYYADSNEFSAAMTPQVAASILKAVELIKDKPEIRRKLWDNVYYLRSKLTAEGFDFGKTQSPIFPIMVRDNKKVYEISDELQKRRIFASGIAYPAVRTKEARIRISLLSTHETWQLDHLVNSLKEIRNIIPF